MCVQFNVIAVKSKGLFQGQGAVITQQLVTEHFFYPGTNRIMSRRAFALSRKRNTYLRIDLTVQIPGTSFGIPQFPKVREIHSARGETQQAVDCCVHGLGLELHRGRRWENELPARAIKFTITDAEIIAGKNCSARRIDNGYVVPGMSWRVDTQQLPPCQGNGQTICRFNHPRGFDRQDLTVKPSRRLDAIHRLRSGNEFGRIDHVPRTTRVNDQFGRRKRLDHCPCATSMIKMYMGQQDIIDCLNTQTDILKSFNDRRQRMTGTAIDDSRSSVFDQQMNSRQVWSNIIRIYGVNAVVVSNCFSHFPLVSFSHTNARFYRAVAEPHSLGKRSCSSLSFGAMTI